MKYFSVVFPGGLCVYYANMFLIIGGFFLGLCYYLFFGGGAQKSLLILFLLKISFSLFKVLKLTLIKEIQNSLYLLVGQP